MFLNSLRKLFFVCSLYTAMTYADEAYHTHIGSNYGSSGALTYAKAMHGPDGALFLDPFLFSFLKDLQGQVLLDIGCGAGPWSIVATKNGATVYGIDIQETMIEQAKKAAASEGILERLSFDVADACALPFQDNFCDKAISINVGCNLPSLDKHISELKRVLKHGGSAMITAPCSFGVLFTDGSHSAITSCIHALLSANNSPKALASLDEVYRATVAWRNNQWTLITDETQLESGEEIWRKIPKMMVPNRYHSKQEYIDVLKHHGFVINQILCPSFASHQELTDYNAENSAHLGASYVANSPFVIFIIEKP